MMRPASRSCHSHDTPSTCIAADADDLLAVIAEQVERERREKIAASRQDETRQIIAPSEKDDGKTAAKAAELFNTNRTQQPGKRGQDEVCRAGSV